MVFQVPGGRLFGVFDRTEGQLQEAFSFYRINKNTCVSQYTHKWLSYHRRKKVIPCTISVYVNVAKEQAALGTIYNIYQSLVIYSYILVVCFVVSLYKSRIPSFSQQLPEMNLFKL